MRPPWEQQSALECWAAAISSWSRVTAKVPSWTVKEVQSLFKEAGHLLSDGSLDTAPGCEWFVEKFKLKWEEIILSGSPMAGVPYVRAKDLTYGHFRPKLEHSHVLTVFAPADPTDFAHWVTVYGADRSAICRMDPLMSVPDYKTTKPCEPYDAFGWGAPKFLTIWQE
jgi:hypothetical protein